MTAILGIDPGTTRSAWVLLDGTRVVDHGIGSNEFVVTMLDLDAHVGDAPANYEAVVIERIEPRYGLRMGWETIGTCEWVGRFVQASDGIAVLLRRSDILRHFDVAGKGTADSGIRAALMDRYGGSQSVRKGGPLYGIHTHEWAALSVAVAYWDGLRS